MSANFSPFSISNPLLETLNFTLFKVYESYQTYLESDNTAEEFNPNLPLFNMEGNRIEIELVPKWTIEQLVRDLSNYDFTLESRNDRAVIGEISILELPEIAQLETLTFVRPHYNPINNEIGVNDKATTYLENPFVTNTDMEKLGFHLTNLYHRGLENPNHIDEIFPYLDLQEGQVTIELFATENPSELLADLNQFDFSLNSSFGQIITGDISVSELNRLAALDSLHFARPVYQPLADVGSTTSQADVSTNSDVAREVFGVTGEGVTIGVLSDSYNNLGGAANDMATGDLPNEIDVLADLSRGGSDEGRAMLQLVHDIAPDADLSFRTAFGGKTDFAQGILDLAEAGADIIVDDVIYLNEPFFQDGIIAQAVDEVVAQGVSYFSSAGNSGRKSYESEFRNSGEVFDLGRFQLDAHDFDPSAGVDLFQEITIPTGGQVSFSFQWDEPFFSVSGSNGARNDIDIFLLDEDKTSILAGSLDANIGNDPIEIFSFTNDGSFDSNQFHIAIGKTLNSDAPDLMKYVGFGNFSVQEFDTESSTLFGHANATSAEAVGAAFFADTPAFGTNPPEIESFSAAAGTPILFDTEGNRLPEAEIRQKPEIVAPDGTNTTFFGNDIAADADSDPNFFGTSAAAPHAAAVAGLLKEADPSLSPTEVSNLLKSTAIDMDDPATPEFDTGFDSRTGYGLIQADEALGALENDQQVLAAAESLTLDVDGNGDADALTDGLLIARYLFDFRGNELIDEVVASDATRNSAEAIEGYLARAESSFLDADGNGEAKALTDGIINLRFLFGVQGEELVDGVLGEGATRTSGEEVGEYLEGFL